MTKSTIGDMLFRAAERKDPRRFFSKTRNDDGDAIYYGACGCPGGLVRIMIPRAEHTTPWTARNRVEHGEDCEAVYVRYEMMKNHREGKLTTDEDL